MPKALVIAKIILCLIGTNVQGYAEGPAAYYNEVSLRGVCEWRNENDWGPALDCQVGCLAAWGQHQPEMLGEYVLAYLPPGGYRL